jgi:predicted small secreted protein
MRLFLFLGAFTVATLSLSACNTIDGVGRDLEQAGRGMQDL